jgi:O-succinylbenzoate synthase
MKVERVELRLIAASLRAPFETSFGKTQHRHILIARLYADGLSGYGECVARDGPWYSGETVETAFHILRDFLVPLTLGRAIARPEELAGLFAPVRGNNMAKATLEMAFWDLWAQAQGVSLSQALGGVRDQIASGVSIGVQDTLAALFALIERHLAEGYRRIKLKIKPGHDLHLAREVRRRFPDAPLMLDANSAYTLADRPLFRALDELELLMIEQPLAYDDIVDHAALQREIRTPLCLDESIHTPEDGRKAIELGSCRVINVKTGRMGGHTQSRRLHDICQERDIPVWCGGMLETGIGRAHNVAMASLPNFRLPGDVSASDRYYSEEVIAPPFTLSPAGTIAVPDGPGIGVQVLEDVLERLTKRRETFTARG